MSDQQTPIQPSFLIDGPGSLQVDPTLVPALPADAVEKRALLGSRALAGANLSEFVSNLTSDVSPVARSISGLSPEASNRETQAVASQVADSIRRTQHRVNSRTGRD